MLEQKAQRVDVRVIAAALTFER
jgi:hypothetical protein